MPVARPAELVVVRLCCICASEVASSLVVVLLLLCLVTASAWSSALRSWHHMVLSHAVMAMTLVLLVYALLVAALARRTTLVHGAMRLIKHSLRSLLLLRI